MIRWLWLGSAVCRDAMAKFYPVCRDAINRVSTFSVFRFHNAFPRIASVGFILAIFFAGR